MFAELLLCVPPPPTHTPTLSLSPAFALCLLSLSLCLPWVISSKFLLSIHLLFDSFPFVVFVSRYILIFTVFVLLALLLLISALSRMLCLSVDTFLGHSFNFLVSAWICAIIRYL